MMTTKRLTGESINVIIRTNGGNGWKNDAETWRRRAAEQDQGMVAVLVAASAEEIYGYGTLIWHSNHSAFAASNVPEISDLVTAQVHRGQGIATMLIAEFEKMAADRGCTSIGIGVGLYADYGPAQRLYTSLGYRPDGLGLTYNHEPVAPGSSVNLDDNLVLWMSKTLSSR